MFISLSVSSKSPIDQVKLEPNTDQSSWQLPDQSQTFDIKEAALNSFAYAIYTELIVSGIPKF